MPYSRPKLSGLYTLSQIKLLENPSQRHIPIQPIYGSIPTGLRSSHFCFLLTKLQKRWRHSITWRKKQYKDYVPSASPSLIFFIVSFYPIPLGLSNTSLFCLRGNGNHCQLCGLSIRLTHIFSTHFAEARNLCKDAFISFFHFDHCQTTNVDVLGCIAKF